MKFLTAAVLTLSVAGAVTLQNYLPKTTAVPARTAARVPSFPASFDVRWNKIVRDFEGGQAVSPKAAADAKVELETMLSAIEDPAYRSHALTYFRAVYKDGPVGDLHGWEGKLNTPEEFMDAWLLETREGLQANIEFLGSMLTHHS